jgi:hypothetical protein
LQQDGRGAMLHALPSCRVSVPAVLVHEGSCPPTCCLAVAGCLPQGLHTDLVRTAGLIMMYTKLLQHA